MPSLSCPDLSSLKAFSTGLLSASTFDSVADHLHSCDHCQRLLEDFDQVDDAFLRGFRDATPAQANADPFPEALANQFANTSSESASRPFSVDHGLTLAQKLSQGPCRLGKFELQSELGCGSFGYVFRARDTELDRIVALKIQRAGSLSTPEELQRFKREARSVAQLQHPGIISLHEIGQTDEGVCFLVTHFIEGQTLEKHLSARPWNPHQAAELMAQIADSLQYAHEHGVIHRDLKPSNILLDEELRPHVTDFGLAKRASGEISMTSDGRVLGTPAYMSPEQARGDSHSVDARTDIYSLGVILYELLTGVRPFQGDKRLLVLQVLEDDPRPPRRLNDALPRDIETICLTAMAKSPGKRYQTARELADDLRRYLAGMPIKARRLGVTERVWRWCRRNPLAASVILALCLGSATGFWYLASLSSYFVQAGALDSTKMEMAMLEEINAYYSDIVDRIDQNKTPVTHEYTKRKNTLPLPATFLIDAGQRISKTESGIQVRLYSDFPWRANIEPKDDFEQKAIAILNARIKDNPGDLSYHEFSQIQNRPFLRYAKGQLMKQTCVKCHNGDPQSPKRDWAEGDLAGVLTITRPVERDVERTSAGLRGAFLIMGVIAVAPLGVLIVYLLKSRVLYWLTT